jgi:hypothetical protein
MYDSTNPGAIPATAQMVAGYVNGPRSQWPASGWDRWGPGVPKIRIDVNGTDPLGSDVIDVENGDATIGVAVNWVKTRQARGWWSAAYTSASNLDALRLAMSDLDCEYWVADWGIAQTQAALMLTGRVVAVQFENNPGSGWDLSVVTDAWFPSPAPTPPPVPAAHLVSVTLTGSYSDGSTKRLVMG